MFSAIICYFKDHSWVNVGPRQDMAVAMTILSYNGRGDFMKVCGRCGSYGHVYEISNDGKEERVRKGWHVGE